MEDLQDFDVDAEIEANRTGAEPFAESSVEENEQPGGDSEALDAKSVLDELEEETPEGGGLLDLINGLKLDRKGQPVEFQSDEEIKEMLLKGFDYTQKTQELSETRKAQEAEWQEKMAAQEEEFNQKVQSFNDEVSEYKDERVQNDIMLDVLKQYEKTDPAGYEEIVSAFHAQYGNYQRSLQNPEFNKLRSELDELKGTISATKKTELDTEVSKIESEWNDGHKALQEKYGVKMKRLGVPAKWEETKRVWQAANASGVELSLEDAFMTTHGRAILAANEAAKKTLEVKKKSADRRGSSPVSTTPNKPETEEERKSRLMQWVESA